MWLPSFRVGVRNSGFRQGTASAVPLVRFLSPVGAGLAPPGVNAGNVERRGRSALVNFPKPVQLCLNLSRIKNMQL
jgi:hypothetical protein